MSGTEWTAPGKGASLDTLVEKTGQSLVRPVGASKRTSLALTGSALTEYDRQRIAEVLRRVREHGEDKGF